LDGHLCDSPPEVLQFCSRRRLDLRYRQKAGIRYGLLRGIRFFLSNSSRTSSGSKSMCSHPTHGIVPSRFRCVSIAAFLSLLAACSHRDPPKCFDGEETHAKHSAAETAAVADGRQRAESCDVGPTQCRFSASTLPSGEILVWVQRAYVDETTSKCMWPVDADGHFLYSKDGNFEERIRAP
jgi:hypothetical protein